MRIVFKETSVSDLRIPKILHVFRGCTPIRDGIL
jgi:hypothetical protein